MFGSKLFNFFLDIFLLRTFFEKFLCVIQDVFDFAHMHPVREIRRRDLADQVKYILEKMPCAMGFCSQREVLNYALDQITIPGMCVEFGVYKGGTLRFLAREKPDLMFHGFDSFEGLPENWKGFKLLKGTFSTGGHLPRVPKNVSLHKGLFAGPPHELTTWPVLLDEISAVNTELSQEQIFLNPLMDCRCGLPRCNRFRARCLTIAIT